MKKLIIVTAILIMGLASAQYKFTVGAFFKDFNVASSSTAASNYINIGLLPPAAFVSSIRVYSLTNTSVITNCLLSVGVTNSTNFFINSLQIGVGSSVEQPITALSNAGFTFSQTAPTSISGRYVYNGIAGTTNFMFRVVVMYVQR